MASLNSTTDGMGFEEVNQASSTELISGTNVYGTNVYGVTGSFVNISGTGFRVGGSIVDTTGRFKNVEVGSPVSYSATVKAGSVLTSAGSSGFITFGLPFSTSAWYVNVTPGSLVTSEYAASGAYVSGLRNASGATFVGAPSMKYDWIAVGV